MKILEILNHLENIAPLSLQESYDNSGIQTGNLNLKLKGVLISLDVTPEVVDEAVSKKCNLIICHHPLIFGEGIKSLQNTNIVEQTLTKAIKKDITIYAIHTNLDNVYNGVNAKLCSVLGLLNCRVLKPGKARLKKIVVFCPDENKKQTSEYIPDLIKNAAFKAGAGNIGNYDSCSFSSKGTGTFRAGDNTNPFVGKKGSLHSQNEVRLEMIFPDYLQNNIISEIIKVHPYEEVAYDIYELDIFDPFSGAGMIGFMPKPVSEKTFLSHVKKSLKCKVLRHSNFNEKKIEKVAVCGGSGFFLLNEAIKNKADVLITSDIKYHNFFEVNKSLLLIDTGHYESEQFTIDLIFDVLSKKYTNFAVQKTQLNTNPVNYF